MDYAFCETITAGGASPWHIRKLSDRGPKYSGGADTPALCGREVAWDLRANITPFRIARCCRKCAAALARELQGAQ